METKKKRYQKYSGEFKECVILDMLEHGLSYHATVRKYWQTKTRTEENCHRSKLRLWERIYLEEGVEGLMIERRGRSSKSRPKRSMRPEVENDLIAENQRLKEELEYAQMELEYIKKLDALVRAEERRNGKKPK